MKKRYKTKEIARLLVGPLELVPALADEEGRQRWAVPGGASVLYDDVVRYARRMGWSAPVKIYTGTRGLQ
jgi:hypothetical protein